MSPAEIAAKDPQRAAYIIAETGQVVTYAELEADANRGAQFFRSLGLQRGDHIALLLENHPD
jgi:acyl-CoA synthetase (AMP-forming)/AMP-acid ligase II